MSGPNANFAFVPWLRRGISAAAGALTVDRRLEATVGVSFGAGRSATVVLEIVGPGEVIGLDHRVESRGPASERVTSPIEPAPSPEADNGDVPLRYQVQTTVPEHWIPFLPVAIDVTRRDVMLERGVLFRSAGEPARSARLASKPVDRRQHTRMVRATNDARCGRGKKWSPIRRRGGAFVRSEP
jgi:hypothetical protein